MGFSSRIRLERIAYLLAYCRNLPITKIAHDCGFASNQTLSRAFRCRFGCSPRDFRGTHDFHLRYSGAQGDFKNQSDSDNKEDYRYISAFQNIQIVTLSSVKVAYVRNMGKYGSEGGIFEAMNRIQAWAKDQRLWRQNSMLIGASWDNAKITPESLCRYDACVEIPDGFSTADNISLQIIPGGNYAVTQVAQQNHEVPDLWRYFMSALKIWPGFKNYQLNFGPWYETYKRDVLTNQMVMNLYAPVSAV